MAVDKQKAARDANAIQETAAKRHKPIIERAIRDAMLEVARNLPTKQRPEPPLDHFRRVADALEALYRETTRNMAAKLVNRFKGGFMWLETKADEDGFYERLYEEYLYVYGLSSISSITETTRQQLIKLIEVGMKQGLSIDEIADKITEASNVISETRAAIIARTETHSAAMFASLESAKRSTIPLVKEWVSVEDARVRDFGEGDGVVDEYSHRVMDGVQVPIDEAFEVPRANGSTEQLMFPGDPNGSPANVINCRCSQVYVEADEDETPDPEPTQRTPGGPAFRYQTIEPPKANTAALNAFVKDNEIADLADLKGVTASFVADKMVAFLEVKERFGLDPIVAVGPASRFIRGGRIKALAAIYPVTNRNTGHKAIWHMPTTFGNRKKWEQQVDATKYHQERGTYTQLRETILSGPTPSDEVRQRAARMDAAGRTWAFHISGDSSQELTADNYALDTIYHEFGHVVHLTNTAQPQMREDINAFLRNSRPLKDGWQYLVSRYAGTENNEYIAETFNLYMRGDESEFYRIHPELLAIYQKYDKAAGGKSVRLILPGVGAYMGTKQTELTEAGAIIQQIRAADPKDRAKVRRELLKAYPHPDREALEAWIDEALTLETVDTI